MVIRGAVALSQFIGDTDDNALELGGMYFQTNPCISITVVSMNHYA